MAELIVLNRTDKKRDILPEKEKRIAEIIKKSSLSQYADFQKGADWDIFYQFTTFREGLVNWYPFQEKGATLIISSGFGALVAFLFQVKYLFFYPSDSIQSVLPYLSPGIAFVCILFFSNKYILKSPTNISIILIIIRRHIRIPKSGLF